jgi:CubicO group peptidase (beta-lactamase class C family)
VAHAESRLRSGGVREGSAKSHSVLRAASLRAHLCVGLTAGALLSAVACSGAGTATPDSFGTPDSSGTLDGKSRSAAPSEAPPVGAAARTEQPPGARDVVPERYQAAARYSEERGGRALLVLEGTQVAVETGQNGHAANAPHALHGGTKAFWGVLAAAAAEDGVLEIDEPVAATLPEFMDDPRKRSLHIRHLLDFTSGLESGMHGLGRDLASDRYARALELQSVASPGERFQYGPGHLFVFGVLLKRKQPNGAEDPLEYLTSRIFEPIGLRVDAWSRDEAGNPDLPSGAVLRAREWAKFGILVRDRGRWRGQSLIDAEHLDACFEGSAPQPRFGLALWLNVSDGPDVRPPRSAAADARGADVFYPDGLEDLVVAAGSGNQRLYVIPSADLVVVRFGVPDREWRDREFLDHLIAGRETQAPTEPASAPDGTETRRDGSGGPEPAGTPTYP